MVAHPLHSISPPELVIGLVGPLGVDLELVISVLSSELRDVEYKSRIIHLSRFIRSVGGLNTQLDNTPEDIRIESYMKGGTEIRTKTRWPDILSLFAIARIREERQLLTGNPNEPAPKTAYILRSLKHRAEIDTLRDVYGDGLLTISIYAPKITRREALARLIAKSHRQTNYNPFLPRAEQLINIDEEEEGTEFGQNVGNAFPLADIFIEATSRDSVLTSVGRFIQIFFGHQFLTPTKAEFAMFLAHAAAIRSADLSRQVGAAIVTDEGDLVALGCNEVPKAHGGLYWADDHGLDGRDFQKGIDPSAAAKEEILAEILSVLNKNKVIVTEYEDKIEELLGDLLGDKFGASLRGAQITSLLEFGRIVHAEMAALTDAARRGISVRDTTLFCTTFPCHMCARLIIAAGLKEVVFIEPYPKSKTQDLYSDSVAVENVEESGDKVSFRSFVGISPNRYNQFFRIIKRKDNTGKVLYWDKQDSMPRMRRFVPSYLALEQRLVSVLPEKINEVGLHLK
jgi:deoxycytidylate deaminase